jgi:hypothetical protein
MPTFQKIFTFSEGTEGWQGYPGNEAVAMDFYKYKASYHNKCDNPPLSNIAGCLKTTAGFNNITQTYALSSENYWEWFGTWEDLGVIGKILSVKLDYLYRWSAPNRGRRLNPTWGEYEAGSGPATLRNSNGDIVGAFSDILYCPSRADGEWAGWPQDPNFPYPDERPERTQKPITEIPASWGNMEGNTIEVPEELQSPGSQIRLRIGNVTPEVPGPWDNGGYDQKQVRFKQDRIVLTIEYDPWDYRVKPSTSFSGRSKPTTNYTSRTKPSTSFSNRTKPTSSYSNRSKPSTDYDDRFGYLLQENGDYILQENGFYIIVKGVYDTVANFVKRILPTTSFLNRSKPTTTFTNRTKPTTAFTGRSKPTTEYSNRDLPTNTWDNV